MQALVKQLDKDVYGGIDYWYVYQYIIEYIPYNSVFI